MPDIAQWLAESEALLRLRLRPLLGRNLEGALAQVIRDVIDGDEASRYLSLLWERCGLRRDMSVLDVGSGLGAFVDVATSAGLRATGLEPELVDISLARRRLQFSHRDAQIVRGVAERLPFASESFHLVTLFNTIEHTTDPRSALREAARVCKAGGHVFVLAPNYAFRWREPHYSIPWVPGLPRMLYARYLERAGRDVQFFRSLALVTRREVIATSKAAGLRVVERAFAPDKWERPDLVQRRWLGAVLRLVATLRLTPLARTVHQWLPRQNIDLLLVKL